MFDASVQYGDWDGGCAADDGDLTSIRRLLEDRGLIKDGEFIVGIHTFQRRESRESRARTGLYYRASHSDQENSKTPRSFYVATTIRFPCEKLSSNCRLRTLLASSNASASRFAEKTSACLDDSISQKGNEHDTKTIQGYERAELQEGAGLLDPRAAGSVRFLRA